MHELSLAEGIVDLVQASARQEAFSRVRTVHLDLGALSNVMPEALTFGFEAAARGSAAEGAELRIRRLPGQGFCTPCAAVVLVDARPALCPRCGGAQVNITGGNEMRVTELEVD
jgi:hydrogenase nickel incorporation protein HypA/HybF